jgi:hypothetical protein
MSRKAVRIGVLIVGVLVTAGLGYRALDDEAALGSVSREARTIDHTAEEALQLLLDLRGSLHAYVAPGQGIAFWGGRAELTLDTLRQRLVTLDTAVSPVGAALSETLDAVDQLAAAEKRARDYTERGEALLAGDVLFAEARDLLSATMSQVQVARNSLAAHYGRRTAQLRQEQAALAAGAVGLWLLIAMLLFPTAVPEPAKREDEWRHELAETIKKPIPSKETEAKPAAPVAPVAPAVAAGPVVPVAALQSVSEICADLSALADPGALSGALERAGAVLNASGLVVWVASNDGGTLSPVATHGFDRKLVSRFGRIARDSSNMTAAAYRENTARTSAANDSAPAAIAVALCGPSGPVGVLTAELQPGVVADDGRVALARIFAAQLATLAMPVPAAAPAPAVTDAKSAAV